MFNEYDNLTILDKNERIFSAIATAEVKDVQGETVPISNFKKAFFKAKKRYGGWIPLGINHKEWVAGQIFDGEEVTINGIPAFKVYGRVFASDDENPLFDDIWTQLKNGDVRGLSIGGYKPEVSIDGVLQTVPLTGISLITGYKDDGQPRNPANPLSKILYYSMAKGDELTKPNEVDEAKWEHAKQLVREQYGELPDDRFYALVQTIYQGLNKENDTLSKETGGSTMEDEKKPSQEIDLSQALTKMADAMNSQTDMLNKIYKAVYKEESAEKKVEPESNPVEKTEEVTDEGSGVEPAPENVEAQQEIEKQDEIPNETKQEAEEKKDENSVEKQDEEEKKDEDEGDDDMQKSDDKILKEFQALKAEMAELKASKVVATTPAPMMKADEGKIYKTVFDAEMEKARKKHLGI